MNEGDFLVRRVVASVLLIFFGFAGAACGNEEAEGAVSGDYAKTGGLSTDDFPVDNQAPEGAQADGRMLKPEGHKGVWFETEPENPWEHYVWESQKYVGDPLELPKLKGQRPNDPLEGLPDVCDEKVVERMKEVGFELHVTGDVGPMYSCHFAEIDPVQGPFRAEIFSLVLDPDRPIQRFSKKVSYDASRSDVRLIGLQEGGKDDECGVAQDINNVSFYTLSGFYNNGKDIREVCQLSEWFFQVFDNVS
ncbi:hypothetical protein ACUY2T_04595 [Corynebacterium sp. 22_2729]